MTTPIRYRKFPAASWSMASAMLTDFARDVVDRLNALIATDQIEDEAVTPAKLADVPAGSMYKTAAQSIANNTLSVVQCDALEYTTGEIEAENLSLWRFVIQRDGIYRIGGALGFTPAVGVAANSVLVASICVNGAEVASAIAGAVLGTAVVMHVTKQTKLVAGQYVDLRAYQNTGNAQSTFTNANTRPHLSIEYVGGL
jgi:hypothetical protein